MAFTPKCDLVVLGAKDGSVRIYNLDKKGEANECYSCSFTATAYDDTTDTVTGTVEDDDGSAPAQPSDSATVTFD